MTTKVTTMLHLDVTRFGRMPHEYNDIALNIILCLYSDMMLKDFLPKDNLGNVCEEYYDLEFIKMVISNTNGYTLCNDEKRAVIIEHCKEFIKTATITFKEIYEQDIEILHMLVNKYRTKAKICLVLRHNHEHCILSSL